MYSSVLSATLLLLVGVGLPALAPLAAQAPPPARQAPVSPPAPRPLRPSLVALHAHYFRVNSGTLSADVLAPEAAGDSVDEGTRRWNAIAGERATNATLVVVELAGPSGVVSAKAPLRVRLVAREGAGATRILDQSVRVTGFDDGGRTFVAFLVRPDGCKPVRLTATLTGTAGAAPLHGSLDFACGE